MIKTHSKLYLFFVIVCSFFTLPTSFAQRIGSSSEKWLMTSTAHFELFYSAQQQDLGLYYARIAEESYAEISTIFPIKPQNKIVVIINDSTDISNGFTTFIPYPYIMIYPVQIAKDEVLSEAAEWAKELFIHELAHAFQLYPAEGFYRYLKPIFGTIVAPNLFTPLWWKEGMAVEIETLFTEQGRTRSYYQDASIRALVLENKLFKYTLAEANEMLPSWPYGSRPYLFGSMIMGQISHKAQPTAIGTITTAQSHRLPYLIEKPHVDIFGYNYESQYLLTLDKYQRNADQQIQTIQNQKISETIFLDNTLINSRHPRWHNNGQLIALIGSEKNKKGIYFYNFTQNSSPTTYHWSRINLKNSPTDDISSFEFHPTDNKIVYAKTDQFTSKNTFSDLYVYDLKEDKSKRLTKGARARNPIWSIDYKSVFFISTFNGKTQLKRWILDSELEEVFWETPFSERINEISVISQNELFVGVRNAKGELLSYTYNLANKTLTQLSLPTSQSIKKIQHYKLRSGSAFFTSTANGVSNIYISENKKTHPLTNLLTGSLDFDINNSKDILLSTIYTSNGLQVAYIKTNTTEKTYSELPQVKNSILDQYTPYERPQQTFSENDFQTQNAKSLKYLYPHYWIPFISTSSDNSGVYLQAMTSGQDPLLIHQYNLSVSYDTYLEELGYNLDYINSAFNWPIDLSAHRTFKPIGNAKNYIDKTVNSVGIIPDMFSISSKLKFNIGMQQNAITTTAIETEHLGLYADISYNDVKQSVFNIYPRGGFTSYLRLESNKTQSNNLSDFYGDYDQALGAINLYSSFLLPENHSIALKTNFLHTLQNVSSRFGTSNSAFPSFSDSAFPEFAARGYGNGQFYGSRLVTLTTEYRFPIKAIETGSGTDPYFIKRLNGAIVVDGLTVKGGSFDKNDALHSENMSKSYWSFGFETRLETTLGYLLPVNFILGAYWPTNHDYSESAHLGLSLQIGGFNR